MKAHACKTILKFVFYLTSVVTVASSTCSSQNCSTFSSGCSTNGNCVCFQMANGTGLCAQNLISYNGFGACSGNLSCPGNDTVCVINSCYGQPLCYPLSYANSSVCPPSNGSVSSSSRPIVTVTQVVTQVQTVVPTTTAGRCFHGETIVIKEDGSVCLMSNLAAGDRILVSEGHQLSLIWSIVLAVDVYQYYSKKKPIEYLEIHTAPSTPALHITPAHSLLVKKQDDTQPRYIFAYDARVGDSIYMVNDTRGADEVTITYIKRAIFYDAYAPLTFEGNFIANNVVVSTYGSFRHDLAHNVIKAPRRWWLRLSLVLFQKQTVQQIDMYFAHMMTNLITNI